MASITRREFVQQLGLAGGYGAAQMAMQSLGLLALGTAVAGSAPAAAREMFGPGSGAGDLGLPPGKGKKIIILGAGIAGLVAAYELGKAGYDCVVLEARERPGGRNWSLRQGDVVEMTDGSRQVCEFDSGLYFNAGPARLPSHHRLILGYCKELGVPLEVEVNQSRSALLQSDAANGGQPIEMRQAINDMRGWTSEMLAKCTNQGGLDQTLTGEDKDKFIAYLKQYGDLDQQLRYMGSERAGYKAVPGAGAEVGTPRDPLSLNTLLNPVFWQGPLFDEGVDMQPTMFQPVGGMDRIPYAFFKKLGGVVKLGSEVRELRNTPDGVQVTYFDKKAKRARTIAGDYCICTIPPAVLTSIASNFSAPFSKAIGEVVCGAANKIAWQAPRFWEEDRNIYGGLTFVQSEIYLIWYPSGGFFTPQGVLIGCYNFDETAARFMAQSIPDRLKTSRDTIEKLFPGRGAQLKKGITVAWNRIPYNLSPWTHWSDPLGDTYKTLDRPEGQIYLAGEHLSHINGWQEGSIASVHRVLGQIGARIRG